MVKVSIIIPVYNVASYLDACISSCINQTFRDIEIIVVNDASPDSSSQIIEKYAAKDNRIVVINKIENEGLIYARKSGIEIARGEYLFHLDGDDFIPETAIECLYKEAIRCDADLAIGDFCALRNNKQVRYRSYDILPGTVGQDLLYELIHTPGWAIWGKLICRTLYDGLVWKPVSMGEDLYQVVQLVPKVSTVVIVPVCVYCQTERDTSMRYDTNQEKVSAQYLLLSESIYSILGEYPYNKKVKEEISTFLLSMLCSFQAYKNIGAVRCILKREFSDNPEFRRSLWKEHKFIYLKCRLFLLSPWVSKCLYIGGEWFNNNIRR